MRLIIGLVSVTDDQKPINKAKYITGIAIKSFLKIDFIAFSPQIYKLIKSTQQAIVNHIKYRLIVHNANLI